ncbi:hypothetical protein BH10ACI4_BH10ACI4_12500 [soil metagenome]
MSAFESWILGYLVNSLWQVPVVFCAAWCAARLARQVNVAAEHRVWVGALLLEIGLPGCNVGLSDLMRGVAAVFHWGSAGAGANVRVSIGAGRVVESGVLRFPTAALIAAAVLYGGTLLYFAGRLGWGLWRTVRMQRRSVPLVLTGTAAQSWERYAELLGVKGAAASSGPGIAVAEGLRGPVAVGVRRGVMLVPPGFIAEVEAFDLEAVLAHELAHIQRRDFAKNLLYELVALPVMFHPVVWLTRARVAESREMICDAMAADAVAGRERYARSLLRLATRLASGTPDRTLHAIGIFDANLFERRVMKLTTKKTEVRGVRRLAVAAACVVVGVGTCASALALRMEVAAPGAQRVNSKANTSGDAPVHVSGAVMAGNVLTRVPPVYPKAAKEAKIQGAVVLKGVIGKEGLVEQLNVVSGPSELVNSAIEAVKQWTYRPYLLNGNPVDVETTVTVTYSIGK